MVRPTSYYTEASPVALVLDHARHYQHGKKLQYDHLFFFSTDKKACEKLILFGGKIYRQYGGWCWVCSKRKSLQAIAKLLEAEDPYGMREEMVDFIARMRKQSENDS